MWYRFTASSTGTLTANTFGSRYDTILAAYTGSCGALSPVAGACNDDANGGVQSRVSLAATAGVTYYFLVTSYAGTGGTLVFQLQAAGGSAPSATPTASFSTPTLTFTVQPGTATLTPAAGTPTATPGLSNDACSNATSISGSPYSDTTSSAAATTDPGDPAPNCGNRSRARSVWYRFTAPSNGAVTANTFGSGYDTILAVFAGPCGALTPMVGGCNDDSVGLQSRVSVPVVAGTTYYFLVTSYQSAGGRLVFQLTF